MFGFSLQKLIFTIAAIAAVWYAFKWIGRLQQTRDARAKMQRKPRGAANATGPSVGSMGDDGVEEMVKCAVCGDYVAKTAAVNCGRTGCPYPG